MATFTLRDTKIHDSLSIVTITGFEPDHSAYDADDLTSPVDNPGDANFLCEAYGMSDDSYAGTGILFTDYDGPDWQFTVLISSDEVEVLRAVAVEAGYTVDQVEVVAEPMIYGDGSGTVAIMKHPEGWVLAD